MATVLDVINSALTDIGVLAAGEAATGDDAADGLVALNNLIDQYAADRLQIYGLVRTTWTIVANTQTYTIGSGGDIAIARPMIIDHVSFQDTSPTKPLEYQLNNLTEDAWTRVPIKTLTSPFPTSWYTSRAYPLDVLTLWPVPTDSNLQGVIYVPTAVAEFSALSTTVALPPGYKRMLQKALAMEMLPSYGRQPSPLLIEQARESKAIVKRSNTRLMDMSLDLAALVQGRDGRFIYDINSGP